PPVEALRRFSVGAAVAALVLGGGRLSCSPELWCSAALRSFLLVPLPRRSLLALEVVACTWVVVCCGAHSGPTRGAVESHLRLILVARAFRDAMRPRVDGGCGGFRLPGTC